MTRIIDLGNGYGRVERYGSEYASLTFPLNESELGKLYIRGHINRDEFIQALLDIGYEPEVARWKVAVASMTIEQWKAGLKRARII